MSDKDNLPELPDGWRLITKEESQCASFDGTGASDDTCVAWIEDGHLVTSAIYGDSECSVPVQVVSAIFKANGVTL